MWADVKQSYWFDLVWFIVTSQFIQFIQDFKKIIGEWEADVTEVQQQSSLLNKNKYSMGMGEIWSRSKIQKIIEVKGAHSD